MTRNSQAIPAIAHPLSVSNTFERIVATRVSCTTQRTAAVTSDAPTPSSNVHEITELKMMNPNARLTLGHDR